MVATLGKEGAGPCASRAFVYFACVGLSFFSSSWCQGLAAACDCGIPWTFLLTFLNQHGYRGERLTSLTSNLFAVAGDSNKMTGALVLKGYIQTFGMGRVYLTGGVWFSQF